MNTLIRTIAPLLVVGAGVGAAVLLLATKPAPKRAEPEPVATRVRIESVKLSDRPVRVRAMGSVIAARRVDLRPEVSGRVIRQHPQLIPGGLVEAEDVLVRIDPRDYRIALEQAEAELEKAQFELSLEKGRQKIARREFELLRSDTEELTEDEYALALRKPHLKNVHAALRAAKSRVERARLDIARTRIEAPFDAVVTEEMVDVGQLVSSQANLATLVGTDSFWVRVSVPVSALDWIHPDGQSSTRVEVRHGRGRGASVIKEGHVLKLLGDLDPKGRMARLLVEIDDPIDLKSEPDARRPLLLDSYVEVVISGRTANRVAVIPRAALREGDEVWVMNEEDLLEIRPVVTSFRGRNEVYVSSGLDDGDRLIISRLAAPVPGMALKLSSEDAESEATTASVDG